MNPKWITDENNLSNLYFPQEFKLGGNSEDIFDHILDVEFIDESFKDDEVDQNHELDTIQDEVMDIKDELDEPYHRSQHVEQIQKDNQHLHEETLELFSFPEDHFMMKQIKTAKEIPLHAIHNSENEFDLFSTEILWEHDGDKEESFDESSEIKAYYKVDSKQQPSYHQKVCIEELPSYRVKNRVYYRRIIRIQPVIVKTVEKHIYKHRYKTERQVIKEKRSTNIGQNIMSTQNKKTKTKCLNRR